MSLESLAYRSNNQSIKQSIDSIDHMFHIGEIFRNFNHQQKKIWIKTLSFFSISAFINLFIFSFSWQKKFIFEEYHLLITDYYWQQRQQTVDYWWWWWWMVNIHENYIFIWWLIENVTHNGYLVFFSLQFSTIMNK